MQSNYSVDDIIVNTCFADGLFIFYNDLKNDNKGIRLMCSDLKAEWDEVFAKTDSFYKTACELAKRHVHPDDMDVVFEALNPDNYTNLLKDKKVHTIYFRYNSPSSQNKEDYIYEKIIISKREDEHSNPEAIVIVSTDVDEEFRNKMKEMEAKKQYYSVTYALGREYSSIYYVEIESGKVTPYNLSNRIEGMFGDQFYKLDYDDAVNTYIEKAVIDSDKEMMRKVLSRKFITSQVTGQDYFTWVYQNNEERYCEMKCVRVSEPDQPLAVVMGFAVKDAEIRLELEEKAQRDFQLSLLDGLSRDYEMVWLLRSDRKMRLFRVCDNPEAQRVALQYYDCPDFDKGFGTFIDRYIAEEDRERVRQFVKFDTLMEKVPMEGMYATTFKRVIANGEWVYIQICFTRAMGPDGEENIVCAIRDVDALIREENRRQELYKNAIKERDLDGLTGIRNRYCYEHFLMNFDKLSYKNVSVIYVDADYLHDLNNTKGHDAGDCLIKTLAQLAVKTWGIDNAFRIGGDEFVVFAFDKEAIKINEQIDYVRREMKNHGYSISAGYCHSSGYDMRIQDMIGRAEKMMYEEKKLHHKNNSDRNYL